MCGGNEATKLDIYIWHAICVAMQNNV